MTHPWKNPKFELPPPKTLVLVALNGGKAFAVMMLEGKLWSDVTAWTYIPTGFSEDSGGN